jgi:hypothetical protein
MNSRNLTSKWSFFESRRKFLKEIWSIKNGIQFIMFLSRLLTIAERNYWSTELETTSLIWVIKKVRHLIQSSKKSMIIQIDHVVIVNICKKISRISINSAMRMNLRLIRVFQFLNQFSNLKIRHKSSKYHLISDALFCLQSLNKENLSDDHVELNELFVEHVIYVYNTILVKLNSEFRARIIERYFKDETWRRIIRTIDENAALEENAAKLFFVRESVTMFRKSNSYMTLNIDSRSSKSVSSFNET